MTIIIGLISRRTGITTYLAPLTLRLPELLTKHLYSRNGIKIDLYEFPHIGLDLGAHPKFLDESIKWLPRLDSNQRQGG